MLGIIRDKCKFLSAREEARDVRQIQASGGRRAGERAAFAVDDIAVPHAFRRRPGIRRLRHSRGGIARRKIPVKSVQRLRHFGRDDLDRHIVTRVE